VKIRLHIGYPKEKWKPSHNTREPKIKKNSKIQKLIRQKTLLSLSSKSILRGAKI
jgi:hypothetical protein